MSAAVVVIIASLACALAITPAVRACAVQRGWLDHALTSRKVHGKPVPRLGGVAIVASFLAAILVFGPHHVDAWTGGPQLLSCVIVGGLAVAALGVYDDFRGAGAGAKFTAQFVVGAIAWACGCGIHVIALPLLGNVELGALGLPLTLLWIAGVINALNLIDGVDGLAAGVSVVVLVTLLSLAVGRGDPLLAIVTGALLGGVLGFLVYNAHPASIFMGDSGSMFIGFVLAVTSIHATRTPDGAVALLTPIVALGYPIADTLLAMGRRAARGVPMFSADRGHIHHRLLSRGFSARLTTIVLCGVSACLCAAAAVVWEEPGAPAVIGLATLTFGLLAALRWLGFFDTRKLCDVNEARRRNLQRRHRVTEIAKRLHDAADPEAISASLAEVGPALDVDHVALLQYGSSHVFTPPPGKGMHVVRYRLRASAPVDEDVLEVGWSAALDDRDTEIAVEQLCPHVSAALRRVGGSACAGCWTTGSPRTVPAPE